MTKLFETVDFLVENIDSINSKNEFEGISNTVWKKKKTSSKLKMREMKKICFGIWNKIYDDRNS